MDLKKETVHVPLENGFLRLQYSKDGEISRVHFAESKEGQAVGNGLEFHGAPGQETVTYISENGVSGLQWADGKVIWGATYEEVPASDIEEISLDDWVDKMIAEMINQ